MTQKELLIAMINRLPDDCTMGDVYREIYVAEAIFEALQSVELGECLLPGDVLQHFEPQLAAWRIAARGKVENHPFLAGSTFT